MAKQEHIELLQQGTEKWNAWRAKHQDVDIDLREAELGGAKLRRADLSGVRLSGADLREVHLSGARLSRADLYGALQLHFFN